MAFVSEQELSIIAIQFRLAILETIARGESKGMLIRSFPIGNCSYASELLQRYLHSIGVETFLVSGSGACQETHVWLETEDGIIVDITGDQYMDRDNEFFYDKPVYVGPMDSFHKLFKQKHRDRYEEPAPDPICGLSLPEQQKEQNLLAIKRRMRN